MVGFHDQSLIWFHAWHEELYYPSIFDRRLINCKNLSSAVSTTSHSRRLGAAYWDPLFKGKSKIY